MPNTTMMNVTTTTNTTDANVRVATPINKLGLKAFDIVRTVGKGMGIVLPKASLNGELVIYSLSSAVDTHRDDDDGMAKVRRYNDDGTIALYSETTGRRLANRDIYTITGIASYVNPILAMKDFINQNPDIDFDPVIVDVDDDFDDCAFDYDDDDADVAAPTQDDINLQMLAMLAKIADKLDRI